VTEQLRVVKTTILFQTIMARKEELLCVFWYLFGIVENVLR